MSTEQFNRLYETHHDRLLRHFRRNTYCVQDAEDLAQHVWVKACRLEFEDRAAGENAAKAEWAWLHKIAHHVLVNHIERATTLKRGRGWVQSKFSDPKDRQARHPGERIERDETARNLRAQIGRLPEDQQWIIRSVYDEGRTLTETAAHLLLPVGTVKSKLNRALEALRRAG